MKKKLWILCLLFPTAVHGAAGSRGGDFGIGLVLGDPTGLSVKYDVDKGHALDAALGFGRLSLHADYLWRDLDLFPQPRRGRLSAYAGLGGRIKDEEDGAGVGIRTVGGAAYLLPRHPVEFFLELAPILTLSPETGVELDAGLGFRYFFKTKKGR